MALWSASQFKMTLKTKVLLLGIIIYLLPCVSIASPTQSNNQSGVIEVVMFNTKSEYTPNQIVILANSVTPILKSYPGFISRKLSEDVRNQSHWIDIVHWASLKDARSAAQKIIDSTQMKRFVAAMHDYTMYHFQVHSMSAR